MEGGAANSTGSAVRGGRGPFLNSSLPFARSSRHGSPAVKSFPPRALPQDRSFRHDATLSGTFNGTGGPRSQFGLTMPSTKSISDAHGGTAGSSAATAASFSSSFRGGGGGAPNPLMHVHARHPLVFRHGAHAGTSGTNAVTAAYGSSMAAELLGTYASRRRVLERAAQMSNGMRDRASEIAEFEERTRVLAGGGAVGALAARERVLAAMQQGGQRLDGPHRNWREPPSISGTSSSNEALLGGLADDIGDGSRSSGGGSPHRTDGDGDDVALAAGSALSESEALRTRIQEKSQRLDRLRGVQRTITELDEVADERRTMRHRAWQRQVAKAAINSGSPNGPGGKGGGETVTSPSRKAAALSANDFDHEASAAPSTASAITADAEAFELRKAFNALLRDGGENGPMGPDSIAPPPPPSPPSRFSSHALAVTLERLGNSLAALVEVTDAICVLATFKARDEQVNVQPHMQLLVAHVLYVLRAHAVALRHLSHFESGERALVEGATFELNALRERFLVKKEALTAQEQRERQAEDARNAVRSRLQLSRARMAMWAEVCLEEHPPLPSQPQSHLGNTRSLSLSIPWVGSRRSSQQWLPPSRRVSHAAAAAAAGVNGNASTSAVAPEDTRSPRYSDAGTLAGPPEMTAAATNGHQMTMTGIPAIGAAATSVTGAGAGLPPYARCVGFGTRNNGAVNADAADRDAEALERRIAAKWGNPYVVKAILSERQPDDALLLPFLRSASAVDTTAGVSPSSPTAAAASAAAVASPLTASPSSDASAFRNEGPSPAPVDNGSVPGSALGQEGSVVPVANAVLPEGRYDVKRESRALPTFRRVTRYSLAADSRAAATARVLSLLQSLLRTVPVRNAREEGDDEEGVEQQDGPKDQREDGAEAASAAPIQVRAATRASIERLIRHLHLTVAKDKERALDLVA